MGRAAARLCGVTQVTDTAAAGLYQTWTNIRRGLTHNPDCPGHEPNPEQLLRVCLAHLQPELSLGCSASCCPRRGLARNGVCVERHPGLGQQCCLCRVASLVYGRAAVTRLLVLRAGGPDDRELRRNRIRLQGAGLRMARTWVHRRNRIA
jgi:hypothetical protein